MATVTVTAAISDDARIGEWHVSPTTVTDAGGAASELASDEDAALCMAQYNSS